MEDKIQRTHWLKQRALEMGFSFVSIAQATELTQEAKQLEAWLNKGYHGNMSYMENHFEKRIDPRLLVEGAQSIVTLMYNYYNPNIQTDPQAPKISMYAYGKDYHDIIRAKLNTLLVEMQEKFGKDNPIIGRGFVDSAPIMERAWAKRSGLGWQGKHTLIINKGNGSFFFLAALVLNQEFVYDGPIKDFCGTCTRCIDACPTKAISEKGYLLDSSRCISYLTIELKDAIPNEYKNQMQGWMFGCDICQAVCPWNRFSKPHQEEQFLPHEDLLDMSKKDWIDLEEKTFQKLFKGSAVKRTKYAGLRRNIDFLDLED